MFELSHLVLSQANLDQLARKLTVPQYDRRKLTAGLVHIGVGGFNRSHLAVYLDDLLAASNEADAALCWGECGIGLLEADRHMCDVLQSQDHLYTLMESNAAGRKARIIGSICDYVFAPASPETAVIRMAAPECRIVSLTITEGGYFTDQTTRRLEATHSDIQYDLEHPETPRTFLGFCAPLWIGVV